MPLDIVWSLEALADLERLHDFLAPHSPQAAAQSTIDLIDGAEFIAANPGLAVALTQFAPHDVRRAFVAKYEMRFEFDLPNNGMVVLRIFSQLEDR